MNQSIDYLRFYLEHTVKDIKLLEHPAYTNGKLNCDLWKWPGARCHHKVDRASIRKWLKHCEMLLQLGKAV